MDWLDPPYQFFYIQPESPIILRVVRYEVGLAMRPIQDPPGQRVVTTMRFHLPGPAGWGLQSYVDFGNRLLIQRVLAVYNQLIERIERQIPFPNTELLRKLARSRPEPLVLRLTRHGVGLNTAYHVEAVGE